MTEFSKDLVLLCIGLILGIVGKAVVDPIFAKRERTAMRRETLLEKALARTEEIAKHIQATRSVVTSLFNFDLDAISRSIIESISKDYGPNQIRSAGNLDEELKKLVDNVDESFRAVKIAAMDIENGATPAQPEFEPTFALQWYETQLSNFAREAQERLTKS